MGYEKLLVEADKAGILIKEKNLQYGFKGLYKNNKILIDNKIDTQTEKACILSEEMGHHYTTYGDITDLSKIENMKQELIARRWSYTKLVGFTKLIEAHKACIKQHELAEYLGVTEEFLCEALEYYKSKYGLFHRIDNYIIRFEPLGVLVKFEDF